jgi:hypothetical protein
LGPQIEAMLNTVYHGLGDSYLHCTVRARTYRIKDDPGLVVDQIVRVISKEWVYAGSGYPCCLRIGERDFLGGLASMAAFT